MLSRLSFIFSVCDSVASILYSNRNLRKKWKEESTDRKKIVLPNGSENLHSNQQPRAAAVVIRGSCANTPQEETVLPCVWNVESIFVQPSARDDERVHDSLRFTGHFVLLFCDRISVEHALPVFTQRCFSSKPTTAQKFLGAIRSVSEAFSFHTCILL